MPQKPGSANNNLIGSTLKQVKDTATSAVKDSIQQVASTPMDAFISMVGSGESNESGSGGGSQSNTIQDGIASGMPTEFQGKVDKERKNREALLRQHRSMLAQYDKQFKQTKAEQEQLKQAQDQQEEQEKEQKKVEQKKKSEPRWLKALKQSMSPGKGEVGKGGN